MFERRLKWLSAFLGAVALLICGRLVQLQLLKAAEFGALADNLLTQPVRYVRAVRGEIVDRAGRVLARDEPAWDIQVHYAVLAGDSERFLRAFARQLRRAGRADDDRPIEETIANLRHRVAETWPRLAALTGRSVSEFLDLGEAARARVERIRREVAARTGVERPIAEERSLHPVVSGVGDELALRARIELEGMPWIDVVPGARRAVTASPSLAHLIGRLGPVSEERLALDALADDELRRLRPGDLCGISGVERLGETLLRGVRGRRTLDLTGVELARIEPRRGRTLTLTVDADLQQRLYDILADAVERSENPSGGAAVVIDVATRDVRALVSYPAYEPASYAERYGELLRDTRRTPLRFRAVADQYAAGSTCKLVTLAGGLIDGAANEHERIPCTGWLLPDHPAAFRCWIFNQYRTTHDAEQPEGQNAEDAVRNSCNIYFFRIGQRLGPDRLCEWLDRFGLGRLQGTGLIEESPAINPTESWLKRPENRGRGHEPADAWNYSIGQGEITITPLQAANVAAAVAAGRWAPVRLVRDDRGEPLVVPAEPERVFDDRALSVLRRGMWRVVNEPGGTAHRAKLDAPGYEMCGKTGSAQAVRRILSYRYTIETPGGRRDTFVAATDAEALERAAAAGARIVGRFAEERFPPPGPDGELPSHAWFIGYTQPSSTPRGAAPSGPVYALAVVIEFGGSGGRVAGPAAKRIAEALLRDAERG